MKWEKLGRVYTPDARAPWMLSHAACPHPERIDEHRYRLHFTSRDADNRSLVGYVITDIRSPCDVLDVSPGPVLTSGGVGAFDDNGVSLGCIVTEGDETRLYYMGWNIGGSMPWRNSIGVAIRDPQSLVFHRPWPGPIIDRNRHDAYSVTYPWVHRRENEWSMWYGSHTETGASRDDFQHVLKSARSEDGLDWRPEGRIIIDLESDEFAITKPCVLQAHDCWHMWFSCCSFERYWIGYAHSNDGQTWSRDDEQAGIGPSREGWDSHSVEYASVFDHEGQWYMLYNGADYGRTGFGIARLEQD